jgi:hypothetical protein
MMGTPSTHQNRDMDFGTEALPIYILDKGAFLATVPLSSFVLTVTDNPSNIWDIFPQQNVALSRFP